MDLDTKKLGILPKIHQPRQLRDTDAKSLKSFLRSFKAYQKLVDRAYSKIEDYISFRLWEKLSTRRSDLFKDDNTDAIVRYFEELIKEQDEEKRLNLSKYIEKLRFKSSSKKSLYQDVLEHVDRGHELANIAKQISPESKNIKRALKKTLETMPKQARLGKNLYYEGKVVDFDSLRTLVKSRKEMLRGEVSTSVRSAVESEDDINEIFDFTSSDESDDSYSSYDEPKRSSRRKSKRSTTKTRDQPIVRIEAVQLLEAFLIEETECHALGICFGCKKPGHYRSNCPEKKNRLGHPKKMMLQCWNCGSYAHRYYECTSPLKPQLQKKVDDYKARQQKRTDQGQQIVKPMAIQQNQNGANTTNDALQQILTYLKENNVQNQQNTMRSIQNPNFSQANGVYLNNLGGYSQNVNCQGRRLQVNEALLQQQQDINQALMQQQWFNNQRSYTPRPKDMSEVCNAIVYEINSMDSNYNLFRAKKGDREIISCKISNNWLRVEGRADTGADTTICSGVNHGNVILSRWPIFGVNVIVRVANGKEHKVVTKGLVEAKVDDTELGFIETLVVDMPEWKHMLIGRDVMKAKGLIVETKSQPTN